MAFSVKIGVLVFGSRKTLATSVRHRLAAMRPGTYSIVARDPATGDLGVAAQSHWLAVGAVLPWAEPGAGAVAVQSSPEPASGRTALELLRGGREPGAVLEALHASDPEVALRQVAIVDARGRTAVHTGEACVREAGHHVGDGFATAASMMLSAAVPDAMADAYEAIDGPFGERLLAALDAAEAEGGDVRGRQSATLLVVGTRRIDLRVDDHTDPLGELRRLHTLDRAYGLLLEAEAGGDDALQLIDRALAIAPDSDELLFWAAVASAEAGRLERAKEQLRAAAALNPAWLDLLDRLEPSVAPGAAALRAALDQHERSRSG
jgi:uncharacterized Ntn-hydrolase superfamily protein